MDSSTVEQATAAYALAGDAGAGRTDPGWCPTGRGLCWSATTQKPA